VRHSDRLNSERSDLQRIARIERPEPGTVIDSTARKRAVRQVHGDRQTPGDGRHAAAVIAVLMGHQDCVDPSQIKTLGLGASLQLPRTKAAVDQDATAPGLKQGRVTPASAAQGRDTH
jgi:hypothetical protein